MAFSLRLEELKDKPPHERGRAFEEFLASLFESAGFDVTLNPAAATPRQTDLFAIGHGLDLLVEAKWQETPLGSPDIDDLRIRLDRTAYGVAGVLFNMGTYAGTAVPGVLIDRKRDLLLFEANEIVLVASGRLSLVDLLTTKREHLRPSLPT